MKSRGRRQGSVLVHTGNGKGKWQIGEQKAAERFDNIEWHTLGDGVTWDTKNPEQDAKTAVETWQFSKFNRSD